jgi:hypothetical protein
MISINAYHYYLLENELNCMHTLCFYTILEKKMLKISNFRIYYERKILSLNLTLKNEFCTDVFAKAYC